MENQKQQLTDAAKIAQFRLSVIAPVIHGLYPDASRNAYYRRVTEKPLTLPDGSTFQYNPKTISKPQPTVTRLNRTKLGAWRA